MSNAFPVVGKEKTSRLDDAWHWQHDEKEYKHIMTVLDRDSGFDQNRFDPAFYVHFPTLEERRAARGKIAKKCLNCGEDAHFARDCSKHFMNVSALINPDVGIQQRNRNRKKMAYMAGKVKKYSTQQIGSEGSAAPAINPDNDEPTASWWPTRWLHRGHRFVNHRPPQR